MSQKRTFFLVLLSLVLLIAVGGCTPAAEEEQAGTTTEEGGYQIPDIEEGMFNVGFVYIGPHDDGGWTQAHDVGRMYVEENVEGVHTAYVENVAEGADSEQVIRSLARKGFDLIITTSFGYMDSTEAVAAEFPDIDFVHVSGYKFNGENFGNVMGAMENMKYLAGMLAGSRAMVDGNLSTGYIATFPIPEELRLGNAFALGMKATCPECTMDVRWIYTWHDPVLEREAAASLFEAGAQVVYTGADTPANVEAAAELGKWGITYDYYGNCTDDACLTSLYWNWGPIYATLTEESMAGEYAGDAWYFDADSGGLGLYGFMEGEEPMPGIADLPEEDVAMVREILAAMLAGEFTRFDVFAGPIVDNQGNIIVPEGEQMSQEDLDQFPPGAPGLECTYCMYWWADGVTAELPALEG